MRFIATLIILGALILAPHAPARAYTVQYTSSSATTQVRWPTTTITIALSTSLNNPPAFVHATGAQVVLAARRALSRWSLASNIQFNVVSSTQQDVNTTGGDGVSLITVADTGTNRSFFTRGLQPGRARVVFNSAGNILEADLAVNPNVTRLNEFGQEVTSFFSTDGTPGSYDLESTFVHEIGHMLGLEHSGIVASSMQPRQGVNGTFDLANFTTRTLSSDDVAGIRAVYGPRSGLGSIAGRVGFAGGAAAFGAHVFAEDVATGRVVAGNIALQSGNYRIDNLPPGQYRVVAERLDEPVNADEIASRNGGYQGLTLGSTTPFLTTEAGTVSVAADADSPLNITVPGGTTAFNPSFIGTGSSGHLSTIAVPFVPGRGMTVLVGGDNLGVIPASGVSVNSPFITVSNVQQVVGFGIPVLSFDISPSILTPPGEYSVRLQSSTGQVSYVSGGLTVDLPNGVTAPNLIDDTQFFVAQQYRDFLSREPDASGLSFWTNEINSCGSNAACREVKRINVSAAFFLSIEFQGTGYLVYRLYKSAFGNLAGKPVPVRFQQLFPDAQEIGRGVVIGQPGAEALLEANTVAFTERFVQRPEFLARFPAGMSAADFVNTLDANAGSVLSSDEKTALITELAPSPADVRLRASVLRKVADDADLRQRELNKAFVLLQYFGYLRRNPDDAPDSDFSGWQFWLDKLNQFGGNFVNAQMVKAFLDSLEYRQRFGPS
ncbi:MAG TPA: matrixin family metalloprotease [Pyrinomonadaceae bacterium]|nr:matrixin family metalloprotease [Pyrinomonadaceae bacterium]